MGINKLKQWIQDYDHMVFLGGAGVSTESDIPDYRSKNGIYQSLGKYGRRPEELLSHRFFVEHPETFFTFLKEQMLFPDAKPNAAHYALAKLEAAGKLRGVVTQNVDALHQKAGSQTVLELHGTVHRNYCMSCHKTFSLDYVINSPEVIPRCDLCAGIVRPDVVLYEEALDDHIMNQAVRLISNTQMLIVGGTSLAVYPAAGLVRYCNGKLVLINQARTSYDDTADLVIHDSIGKVLSEAVAAL
jgi:NAD-dependent deacetylase